MKKVVRLNENDLNRLVKRIISETSFDDSDIPKNGVPLNDRDIEILLSIAKDYCNSQKLGGRKHYGCSRLGGIEQKIDDTHSRNSSKRSKHSPWDGF